MLNPKYPSQPQSSANVVPRDDAIGIVQPILALYASIWAIGMLETVAHATPFSASPSRLTTLLENHVQPGQNSSGPLSMNW